MTSYGTMSGTAADVRFGNLFELIGDPVVDIEMVDQEPIVRAVNPAFEDVFGYGETRVTGESLNEFIVPEDCRSEATNYDQRTANGKHSTDVVTRQTATGPREFLYRGVPYERDGGQYGLAIYTDVTDQKKTERELKRQNERLEEFASIVAHDLRNPINVVKSRIELLQREYDDEAGHFAAIEEGIERMESIIDEVLTMSRQGQTVEETDPVDLATVCADAWKNVDTDSAAIEVRTERTIEADRSRVLRVFENLFRNSVEHGSTSPRSQAPEDGSGSITVEVGDLPGGFYIADDGPGIPEAERTEVFEKGYTTAGDGAGFGLAIVQAVVDAHGWDVTVTESDAGGARFEIGDVTEYTSRLSN